MPSMETPVNTARVAGEPFYRARNTAPYALAMAAVAAFSFLSGGYVIGRSTPIAVALLCAAAVWVWFLRRSTRPPLLFLVALGVFGAFTVWSGLSVLWSFGPDLTWVSFNLTAFYLAVVAVLGLTSARGLQLLDRRLRLPRRRHGRRACTPSSARVCPTVVTHAHTYARLDSPVGYWNVLALMMVMGLAVALAVAGDRATGPVLRTLAAAAAVPMCFTFFFTFSRGGWIALAVALVLYFAFTTTRLASFVTLLAVVTPVALVLWRLRGLETLFAETTDDALRTPAGRRPAALGDRGAAGHGRRPAGGRPAPPRRPLATLVDDRRRGGRARWSSAWSSSAAPGATSRRTAASRGSRTGCTRWSPTRSRRAGATRRARLTTLTTNGRIRSGARPCASRATCARRAPAPGRSRSRTTGSARTAAWSSTRTASGSTCSASSAWSGLALFVAAIVLFVAAMVGNPFARRRDPLHPLLVALQAGVVAFFVHMSWDWDWDMAAVGTLVFVFIAVCVSYRSTRRAEERRRERRAERAGGREAAPADGEVAAGRRMRRSRGRASIADDAEQRRWTAWTTPTAPIEPARRRRRGGARAASAGRRASSPARRWCCWP